MATPRRRKSLPPRPRVVGLAVVLVLLGGGCGSGAKLGAHALSQQSKSLQSAAAEGALLAQDAASGRTTRVFTREHSSELSAAASKTESTLKAATTEPALEGAVRRLAVIAGQVGADLERLGSASRDEARALAHELEAAAEASRKIGAGLE